MGRVIGPLNAVRGFHGAGPVRRSEIDNCSDRRNRRISAQSSTLNTRFLPGSSEPRVSRKLVKIQLPRSGQYSVAADTLHQQLC